MKKYWGKEEVVEEKSNETFIKEPSFIETLTNRIYFYSEIDRDRVLQLNRNIRQMNNELLIKEKELSLKESINIFLHINSYGGSIFAGLSSMDEILNSQVPITTIVDGCCASAATFLSVVGSKRLMHKHSFMLIHQLSSFCWGKHSEFMDEMENQKKLMSMVKDIYKKYTKVPMNKIDEILKHDLWFNSEECIKYGLVDEII